MYFELITGVDENVGRLLDALKRTGQLDNTAVIFTSDNGYYLREHGLGDKRTAYEESMRVPLLVKPPAGPTADGGPAPEGTTADRFVLNIDLCPTVLDYAGVPVPAGVRGRSYAPLAAGEPVGDWRTEFFYKYLPEKKFPQPHTRALRGPDRKLIVYPGHDDWTQLFDLRRNPHELGGTGRPVPEAMRKRLDAMKREAVGGE